MKRFLSGALVSSALLCAANVASAQTQLNTIRRTEQTADQTSAVNDLNSTGASVTARTSGNARPAETAPTLPPVASSLVNAANGELTSLYRVGVGDVLDVRLLGVPTRQSTLYTVVADGLLEYALVGDPLLVSGLTTEEIASRLADELRRRRISADPQVSVVVRDYVSHTVTVSGLIDNPGTRVLRREGVPLYVVLAESLPRSDAGRVTITRRATSETMTVDLNDTTQMNTLVHSGDVITVQNRLPQFFYIGGGIGSAGQKNYHAGMTLTQAILASGGAARYASNRVRVSRQSADERLTSTEYDLRDIRRGRVPDPLIQPGDRIEVGRNRW